MRGKATFIIGLLILGVTVFSNTAAFAGNSFIDALEGGITSLFLRYRYESVDQEGIDKDARASTLKTALGYKTGDFHGFQAFVQFENTSSVGDDKYNSTQNGRTEYPVVADPEDSEINQAYLSYTSPCKTVFKFGRQQIILDNARFVGNVGWRQNMQTYDAFSVSNISLPKTTLFYAYVENVNRIVGEGHSTGSDHLMSSHLLNASYSLCKGIKITGYGYLLDFENAEAVSAKTFGIRLNGGFPIGEGVKILYTGEFAAQSAFANGDDGNDADYMFAELGVGVGNLKVWGGFESLEGDGNYGFSTPLATAHAFNGWADKFLGTPGDGLIDTYVKAKYGWNGYSLTGLYHMFSSDNDSYDYGSEIDLVATKKLGKWLVGLKYSAYSADDNSNNMGGLAVDIDKGWAFIQLKI